jgi:hypothetical protein
MPEVPEPTYDDYEDILHRHYDEHYDTDDYPFERYGTAYAYGHRLAKNERYSRQEWLEIEGAARKGWEAQEAGPWEDFKEAIRYAFNLGRDTEED